MKIALVTDGIYPFVLGGMQRHSSYLTRYLTRQGVKVVLVHCVTHGERPTESDIINKLEIDQPDNLEIITLRFPSFGKLPGHYLRESLVYSEMALKALAPHLASLDLIYAKGLSGWTMAEQRLKKRLDVPLAVKFHGYEMYQRIPGWRNRFARLILRGPVKFTNQHADFVFSYGGKITEIVTHQLGVDRHKVADIPTGITEDWVLSKPPQRDNCRRFVFVGRYERRKGVEEINKVLMRLLEHHDFTFDFVGPVPFEKRIKHTKVTYHGQVTDTAAIKAILDKAHVLVTPSHAEGMPNVIMEGMARGLAIIATDVGAVSAAVDETNGWLIEPHSPDKLELAIVAALALDSDGLTNKQHASIKRVQERFTWSEIAKETIAAIHSFLQPHAVW